MEERAKDIAASFVTHVHKMAGIRADEESEEGIRNLTVHSFLSFFHFFAQKPKEIEEDTCNLTVPTLNSVCPVFFLHRRCFFHKKLTQVMSSVRQVDSILDSIYVYRVHDYIEQIAVVTSLQKFLDKHPQVKLVRCCPLPQTVERAACADTMGFQHGERGLEVGRGVTEECVPILKCA